MTLVKKFLGNLDFPLRKWRSKPSLFCHLINRSVFFEPNTQSSKDDELSKPSLALFVSSRGYLFNKQGQ